MPYVQRDEDGIVCGQFANRQPGVAEEWLDAESAELSAHKPQAVINAEARAYLAETDWYVIRQQETGEAVPGNVLTERAAARARVVE